MDINETVQQVPEDVMERVSVVLSLPTVSVDDVDLTTEVVGRGKHGGHRHHFLWRKTYVLFVERGSSVGRMPDSQSREPGFESPLLPFRSLGIFFHFTTPQSTQLYK